MAATVPFVRIPPKPGGVLPSVPSWFRVAVLIAVIGLTSVFARTASANREHRVREGQTLSAIAQRYSVRITSLAAANGLRPASTLRVGQVLRIPETGVVYVQSGQTLSAIARAHDVSVNDLARANRISPTSSLQVGQRLVLPGHERTAAASSSRASAGWGRPRNPGVVSLKRVNQQASVRMRLVDSRGRARAEARRRLAVLMEHRSSGRRLLPEPRLMQVLTTISDHFGGRRIYIVSGYRVPGGYTRESSRHAHGDAVDIRVEGVPNTEVRDYCRTLPRTGCGYYPNSTFVHVDVRSSSAYWVDYSRPGEAPKYRQAQDGARGGGGEQNSAAEGDLEESASEVDAQDAEGSEGA